MGQNIRFFRKNEADYSNTTMTVTASQNNEFAMRALNRSNLSSWVTTGSVDADNTTFEVDFHEPRNLDSILLVNHNFKNYTIQYYNGSSYVDFTPAINVSNGVLITSFFQFTQVAVEKVKLTITGTQVANSDKQLYQFIMTTQLGQFLGNPVISNLVHNQNKVMAQMLSGRMNINKNLGGTSFDLAVAVWKIASDIALIQNLYASVEGFLVWLSGGDESQFSLSVSGYRLQDIVLMQCKNDLSPDFFKGLYKSGLNNFKVSLVEINT